MPHYVGTLPWQSDDRYESLEERRVHHSRWQGQARKKRDTRCNKCEKHFVAQDVKRGLCLWCWYDQGIVFEEKG